MGLEGVGNTQTCSMAVCAKDNEQAFYHKVEGYIDWQYSRAYVVTKLSKETGMPIACVAYEHKDDIAKLNDSKGGQQKLLKQLQSQGPRIIRLYPIRKNVREAGRPKGKLNGSHSSRPVSMGAKLRFAVAQLGGVPA